ncbi:hypothetical protein F5888DRAFT_1635739 [Russula emetica]|nr:hypothetical protein F5888DRAFT_1635739 [Russula emetica]
MDYHIGADHKGMRGGVAASVSECLACSIFCGQLWRGNQSRKKKGKKFGPNEGNTCGIGKGIVHIRQDSILNSVYCVSSGKRTGIMDTWADAGDACQGIDSSQVIKIHVSPVNWRRQHYVAYVVFEGLAPRIYGSWEEVEPLVKGIPGNVHQDFIERRKAECAYVLAFAMGTLRILPARHDTRQQAPAPASPMPEALVTTFASVSDDFLGAEWHVVFKGKRPGVYPAWNFVVTQTKGISCAIFQRFPSRADAEAAYRQAAEDGYVVAIL